MVDPRRECKFWRFEGVVGGEVDVEEEDSTLENKVLINKITHTSSQAIFNFSLKSKNWMIGCIESTKEN